MKFSFEKSRSMSFNIVILPKSALEVLSNTRFDLFNTVFNLELHPCQCKT